MDFLQKDKESIEKLRGILSKHLPSDSMMPTFVCKKRLRKVTPDEYCTNCTCGAKNYVYKVLKITSSNASKTD